MKNDKRTFTDEHLKLMSINEYVNKYTNII